MSMSNPLLNIQSLPPFSQIKPEHIQPAVEKLIQDCRDTIEQVLKQPHFTWENFILPLTETNDRLNRAWSPVSHLNSVKNSAELREAYQACLPLLSEYSTWVGQHKGLYNAYLALKNSAEFADYSIAQKKAIENSLRDFELSGIGLSEEKQQRYGEIVARLSELNSQFSNNVLDATMGWEKLIENEAELAGLPESALQAAQQSAESKGLKGYRFTLEIPSYLPVMTYCEIVHYVKKCTMLMRHVPLNKALMQANGTIVKLWKKFLHYAWNWRNYSVLILTPNFHLPPKWQKIHNKCLIS